GFLGVGVNYFRSPKFIQVDGGWNRVVWMAKALKEQVVDDIPEELRDKIATEETAPEIESLKEFLSNAGHPVVERWEVEEEEVEETEPEEEAPASAPPAPPTPAGIPMAMPPMPQYAPSSGGGGKIKLFFKNATIKVERVVIEKQEDNEDEK
ncbi:MAG: CO dehydrogenase/CO-methylating acetyl-CoA synthase complex subunit beta, partial [Methermicoccaceae archaeon]